MSLFSFQNSTPFRDEQKGVLGFALSATLPHCGTLHLPHRALRLSLPLRITLSLSLCFEIRVDRFEVDSSSDFEPSESRKMYADRVENGGRRSVKERLNGNGISGPTRHQQQRQITGKRFAILTSCFCDDFLCFWRGFKFGCDFRFDRMLATFVIGMHVEVR